MRVSARRMGLARALAIAMVLAAMAVAAAPAGAAKWRVSGTISGTYTNQTGWTSPCPGSFSARTTPAIRLGTPFVSEYRRESFGLRVRLRLTLRGTWSLTGGYQPNNPDDPTGMRPCNPPRSVSCTGGLIGDRLGDRVGGGTLVLTRMGGNLVGGFEPIDTVMEDGPLRRGIDPICNDNAEDTTIVPFYGVVGGIGSVTAQDIRVPRARLLGRRTFTVTGPTQRLERCADSDFYTRCTERSTIRVRLRFTPA